jgi:hypothetical protein
VHAHGGSINPFRGEAMRDGGDFDVLLEDGPEDDEMIFSLLATHDPLYRAKPDVVLVVHAVSLQPLVEVLHRSRKVMESDHFIDDLIVHPNFQNVLK